MEEERYYIENDMIIDEDKWIKGEQDIIIGDTDNLDDIVDLLNQQDKQIKELLKYKELRLLFDNSIYGSKVKEYPVSLNLIASILIEEYKHNKELKEENRQLREDLQAKDILVNTYMSVVGTLDNAKQLKQSQKELTIKELVKLLNSFNFYEKEDGNTLVCTKYELSIFDYIGIRIKELELRGE